MPIPTIKVTVTDRAGTLHAIEAEIGLTLMENLRDSDRAALRVRGQYGGEAACGTCHVYVEPNWCDKLSPRLEEEDSMLDEIFNAKDESRLACQITLTDSLEGLEVTLTEGT